MEKQNDRLGGEVGRKGVGEAVADPEGAATGVRPSKF